MEKPAWINGAKTITVFGPSYELDTGSAEYWQLFSLGQHLAKNDYKLVTGGAAGTLDAICMGYHNAGDIKSQAFFLDNADIDSCNQSVADHTIVAGGIDPRFNKLIEAGDAFICLPPKHSDGTLQEFANIICKIKLGEKEKSPIIIYDIFEDFKPIAEYITSTKTFESFIWKTDPFHTVDYLNDNFKTIKP